MTVHPVGARPQLAFKMPTIACSYLHAPYVAMGGSREPERTGRVEAATESACDNLRNLAHARSASIQLASNCWAVTWLQSGTTSGGRVLNKCAHFSQLAAVPLDWGAREHRTFE